MSYKNHNGADDKFQVLQYAKIADVIKAAIRIGLYYREYREDDSLRFDNSLYTDFLNKSHALVDEFKYVTDAKDASRNAKKNGSYISTSPPLSPRISDRVLSPPLSPRSFDRR